MKHFLKHLLPCLLVISLGLVVSSASAAEQPSKELLPINIFKNLKAGKKQSVVVYGTSLSDTSEWPKALTAYFDQQFPGLVTFTKAASSGKESNWGVANLPDRVLSKNPDLIFIEFSMNDAATKHHISPEQATANLDSMVKSLRQQNPQMDIILQTMNSVFDGNDGKQAATARPELETYYEGYRKYAREQDLPLIDHYPNWRKLQQEDEEKFKKWLPDGTHPVPEASLAVTWTAIQALLEKARASAGAVHLDPASAPLRLVIVGDSTVADYPAKHSNRGWGMYIEECFKPGMVKVINLATPGRSTKTFIKEGRWKKALEEKPDYVLIQFGHNDSHAPEQPEATDAATDYMDNLRRYIDESRATGATPILVTPMVRRRFDAEGKITSEPPPSRDLGSYADAMRKVATEKKVPVIDLYKSSKALAEQLGQEASAKLANKKGDDTHFNEKGARAMADLVMNELPVAAPKLKENLK